MAGIFLDTLPIFIGVGGIFGLTWIVLTPSRERPIKGALRWLASRNWLEIVLVRVPVVILLISLTGYVFLSFKVNIPNFAPFSWDHAFAKIDRLLFFGYDPWVLTHWVFPGLDGAVYLDAAYVLWFVVMNLCNVSVALLPMRNHTRLTYLLAYGINGVIGGGFIAIMMPAVGPVYMEKITGDPTFVPLMDLLYQYSHLTELRALRLQEILWESYANPDVDPLGISAFPSMHVEMAATFACLGFAVNRVIGWTLAAFTAIILIGSVHLGWHYAIDGIGGIALALLFWWISARVTSWWLARTDPGGTAAATGPPVTVN